MKKTFLLVIVFLLFASSASATDWYVDKDAAGTNAGTSWTNAWETFAAISWGGIAAGDTLYISGGSTSKTYLDELTIQNSGTNGNQIHIRAGQDANHNGTVVIDCAGTPRNGRTVGIWWNGETWLDINGEYGGNRHIKIANCTDLAGGGAGINGQNVAGATVQYVEIDNCAYGIINTYASSFIAHHNYIHRTDYGQGIYINGSTGSWDNNLVYNNEITSNSQMDGNGCGADGIFAKHGLTAYNNTIYSEYGFVYGYPDVGVCQHMDAFHVDGNYNKVYNNTIQNMNNACWEIAGSHWRIYNNTCAITNSGLNAYQRGVEYDNDGVATVDDIIIANNTFVDVYGYYPIRLFWKTELNPTVTNIVIKNNLFYNSGSGSYHLIYMPANSNYTQANVDIDYNLINAGANGGTGIDIDGATYTQAHPFSGAPTFTSYTERTGTNDFHLTAGSPGIDQGVSLSSYFTIDKDSVSRPQGAAWDIGAYEFVAAATQVPVLSPGVSIGGGSVR